MNAYRYREVSIVPQYAMSALNPIRKIGRMISELLDSRGVTYDDTLPELSRRLALVGLDDSVLDRYPIELSGGMKQRVVMVLSTLLNPSLLIADELTSALDVSTQKAVAEMLVEFRDRKFVKSTIVITHDLSILYQIADTILVMYAGKLVEKASATEITEDPAASVHAALVGIAARGRCSLRGEAADGHPRPARRRSSTRRQDAASARAVRWRSRNAPRSHRSWRSRRGASPPVGRRLPDARAQRRHQGLQDGHVRQSRDDRRLRRQLHRASGRGRLPDRRERQWQDDRRPNDPAADRSDGRDDHVRRSERVPASIGATSGATTPMCRGSSRIPFSSYNPVFKVDRVLGMIRSSYLPGLSARDWKAQLRRSLEAVSLEPADVLGKYPHQLSGGQLQRLMIARALLLDIKFLVADEIISMLDASTRIDVLNLLGDLKERGVGILFITHDLSLGNYISDKTLILRRGKIAEYGPTPKVFGNPSHPYTRALLASVPQLHRKWETPHGARRPSALPAWRPPTHRRRTLRDREPTISSPSTQEGNTSEPDRIAALHRPRRSAQRISPAYSPRRAGLGFEGVELHDLHGHSPRPFARLLDANGLVACGRHAGLRLVENELEDLADELGALGTDRLIVSWIEPPASAPSCRRDDCDRLLAAAERVAALGLRLGFHNHDGELALLDDGRSLLDRLLDAGPTLFLELDLGWIWYAGLEPLALLERAGARAPLVHVKDMRQDGGPVHVPLGDGDRSTTAGSPRQPREQAPNG